MAATAKTLPGAPKGPTAEQFPNATKLSQVCAEINQMTMDELVEGLRRNRISYQGSKPTLRKRLKNHHRRQASYALCRPSKQPSAPDKFYDYLCVVDFECTCEDGVYEYEHEIIEFPVVLVDTRRLEIVDCFHAVVRPLLRPVLSDFCIKLTGISQAQVNAALPFIDVMDMFRAWMERHRLGSDSVRYAFVTDGPWDFGKFLQLQCLLSGMDKVPHDLRYWVNLRRAFASLYRAPDGQQNADPKDWKNLQGMLDFLGMRFDGRPHSGRDDATNIARIAMRMLTDGCELRVNERLMRRDRADKLGDGRRDEFERKRRQMEHGRLFHQGHPTVEAVRRVQKADAAAADPTQQSQEDRERQAWRSNLPYKVVTVTKNEFLLDMFDDCETCEEADSNDEAP